MCTAGGMIGGCAARLRLPHDVGPAGNDAGGVLEVQVERAAVNARHVTVVGVLRVELLHGEALERSTREAAQAEGQAKRGPVPVLVYRAANKRDAPCLVVEGCYQVRVVRIVQKLDGEVAHERDVDISEPVAPGLRGEDMELRGFVFLEITGTASFP